MRRALSLLVLLVTLGGPAALRAEGGPHYLLIRGPAPPALELALEEELPGARAALQQPHAMRVIVLPAGEGWRLELRRPGGRLLLSRELALGGGEEAALRVVVFLTSRTLARFGPGDDVAPEALVELEPAPVEAELEREPAAPAPARRRAALALLATLPWWQRPALPHPGVALESGVGTDLLRLSVRLQAAPPQTITTAEVEARITDAQLAAQVELGLLRGVRGELGLGAAAGLLLGWTSARARFPAAPGSKGVVSHFFDPAPWAQVTANLALDPGDPRVELLGRAGFALRPLPRRVVLPPSLGEERTGIEEGFLMPVLEVGLRAIF
ncbi:MAG: hypothetical protein P1V51_21750 [Deltaproteobacteria bacterium]|nr:hypothetical protein [Deltaproteobacteria bacterium]